jgi:hypothetical protein
MLQAFQMFLEDSAEILGLAYVLELGAMPERMMQRLGKWHG